MMSTLDASGGIAAPIVVAGELWGALGAAYSDTPIPPGAELRLERFARLVGLTISNTAAWDRLARQASTDPLTGLPNRRAFNERLSAEIARAKRHDRNLSIVLLDLDHFKRINDEHGHQAGDRALVRFAQLLQAHTRGGEVSARIGGEEFAWLLPETDQAGAYTAADRVRLALENEPFADLGTLTVSAGVRSAGPSDDADALINDADQALYWAKNSGRNMTFIYSEQARQTLAETHPPIAEPATPPTTRPPGSATRAVLDRRWGWPPGLSGMSDTRGTMLAGCSTPLTAKPCSSLSPVWRAARPSADCATSST